MTDTDSALAGLQTIRNSHYRLCAQYHRVMMLFWFYDEAKVSHHAEKMDQYINWDRLKEPCQ